MTISPVIERELRLALRKKNSRKSRFKYAAIGVGLATFCLIVQAISASRSFALTLHGWLFYLGLYVAVVETLQLTADLFIEERQNGMLGLLYLAGLSMRELFGGKVLAAFLVASSNLLALAPCMAVPFLTGGVSMSLFLSTLFCLPTMLVFTLAVVCLGSVLWKEESTARVGAVVSGSILSLVPLGIYELSTWSAHPISPLWRVLSPAWGPWMIHRKFLTATYNEFWLNQAVTLAWSCVFFILAGFAMRRSWKREISGTVGQTWFGRVFGWIQGNLSWRRKQAFWLDINPYVWLALSNRRPVHLAWAVVAMITTSATLCCWIMPRAWLRVWIFFAVAIAVNLAVEWIVAHTSAKRLSDDRRSNALELLLTTPLGVRDLIDGQLIALDLQFRPIFIAVSILNSAMMLGGFFLRSWDWRALSVYVIIWFFILLWSSRHVWGRTFHDSIKPMWAGLNTGLPSLAVARSWGLNHSWYVLYQWWFWMNLFTNRGNFPSGSWTEFVVVTIFATFIGISLIYHARSSTNGNNVKIEEMLLSEFRLIAAEPLPDPNDPRLKKWNIRDPLYHYRKQLLSPVGTNT